MCSDYIRGVVPDLSRPSKEMFPIELEIELVRVPGPIWDRGRQAWRYNHRFTVSIGLNYPYEKPAVRWLTPLFHPNIMMPEDGGHLCTKLLEDWRFNSTMITFIKGVESLLSRPNPASPFGTESCARAARHFSVNGCRAAPLILLSQHEAVRR